MAEKRPFKAYSGNGYYIFTSYCHADGEMVYAQLDRMFCAGYNIWYDQGIPNNSVIDRQIESAITRCTAFVIFLSPKSAASKYVSGTELPLAKKKKKEIIYVLLSDDDTADYSGMTGGARIIRCDELLDVLPASCRECTSRKPQPIQVDTSNGFEFDSNSLVGIEYYLIGGEAVIESYNNLGAVNDVKELSDELYIPDTIAGYPVTGISRFDAYDTMYETESLFLPESLTVLGNSAFAGTHVPEIRLSTRTKMISAECFAESAITDIFLPYGLECIGDSAFEDCEALEDDVVIPETVTSIGDCAFSGCCYGMLTVFVPPQVTDIGVDAFNDSMTICCVAGSAAHRYAEEYGLEVDLITAEKMAEHQSCHRNVTQLDAQRAAQRKNDAGNTAESAKPAYIIADEADMPRIQSILNELKTDGISFAFASADTVTAGTDAAAVFLSAANVADSSICAAAMRAQSFPVMLDESTALPEALRTRFVMHAHDRTPDELYGELRDFLLASGCTAANLRATAAAIPYTYYFCDDYLVNDRVGIELHAYKGHDEKVVVPSQVLHLPVEKLDECFEKIEELREVEVSSSVRCITTHTFHNCPNLKKIIIPPTVEEVSRYAVVGCPSAVVYAERRSPAYLAAKKAGVKVKHMKFKKQH